MQGLVTCAENIFKGNNKMSQEKIFLRVMYICIFCETFFRFHFVQSRGPLFYCHITSAPVIYVPIWENHVRNKFCLNLILLYIEPNNNFFRNFVLLQARFHFINKSLESRKIFYCDNILLFVSSKLMHTNNDR